MIADRYTVSFYELKGQLPLHMYFIIHYYCPDKENMVLFCKILVRNFSGLGHPSCLFNACGHFFMKREDCKIHAEAFAFLINPFMTKDTF